MYRPKYVSSLPSVLLTHPILVPLIVSPVPLSFHKLCQSTLMVNAAHVKEPFLIHIKPVDDVEISPVSFILNNANPVEIKITPTAAAPMLFELSMSPSMDLYEDCTLSASVLEQGKKLA